MLKSKLFILSSIYSLHRDDVPSHDVPCMIFVMPCDAEIYCDDLK